MNVCTGERHKSLPFEKKLNERFALAHERLYRDGDADLQVDHIEPLATVKLTTGLHGPTKPVRVTQRAA